MARGAFHLLSRHLGRLVAKDSSHLLLLGPALLVACTLRPEVFAEPRSTPSPPVLHANSAGVSLTEQIIPGNTIQPAEGPTATRTVTPSPTFTLSPTITPTFDSTQAAAFNLFPLRVGVTRTYRVDTGIITQINDLGTPTYDVSTYYLIEIIASHILTKTGLVAASRSWKCPLLDTPLTQCTEQSSPTYEVRDASLRYNNAIVIRWPLENEQNWYLYDDLPADQPGPVVQHGFLGDVQVPAGQFHSCYGFFTFPGPGHSSYRYCPHVGFVQFEDWSPNLDDQWSMTLVRFEG